MKKNFLFVFFLCCTTQLLIAQPLEMRQKIESWIDSCKARFSSVGEIRLSQILVSAKRQSVEIYLNGSASYVLFRPEMVDGLYRQADSIVRPFYPKFNVVVYADKKEILTLIPNYFRPVNLRDKMRMPPKERELRPFVRNDSKPFRITHGLLGRNIALWSSHGLYYNQMDDRWMWQRSRLFTTVEDKLTLSYVLPYLVPMLENAGAGVFLPQERDVQVHEVVVDADVSTAGSFYMEDTHLGWEQGGSSGFAWRVDSVLMDQNPFVLGTYRMVHTKKTETEKASWIPEIPKTGDYAVYVSYQTKSNAIPDAHYTVFHAGGQTSFVVNQTQGGGTWVYLGTFRFKKGINTDFGSVTLSNQSDYPDRIVTADAVRFGGGMGNVARKPAPDSLVYLYNADKKQKIEVSPFSGKTEGAVSQCPRYLEASRYWLQWAGFQSPVYTKTNGVNDYIDDISCRGLWVNALNNGSEHAPDSVGLGIPIDLALGFHTDAGVKQGDSIVGSLGIFMTKEGNECFCSGQSRYVSRDLTDLVLDEIKSSILKTYRVDWPLRGVRNRSYAEARIPQVPTMLLELLSHQNLTDMRFALDPNFQFLVCRSVYKALLNYFSVQHHTVYDVQPLPVNSFNIVKLSQRKLRLSWRATFDSLEVSGAKPTGYVVYMRQGDGGFDNGVFVEDTTFLVGVDYDKLYSFKVSAVNGGGESFSSETLSACLLEKSTDPILVINGFDRLSAPDFFDAGNMAGVASDNDCGVPYGQTVFYTGSQYEYEKSEPWIDNDNPGFGASYGNLEETPIAGNTFDYPYVHGKAIHNAGYSFVSCSRAAVECGMVALNEYKIVNLILGKERRTMVGLDSLSLRYETFSGKMRSLLCEFFDAGGGLFVSGAYVASDTWHIDRSFVEDKLRCRLHGSFAPKSDVVERSFSKLDLVSDSLRLCVYPSEKQYHVTSVDGIVPADKKAYPVLRYAENQIGAAVAWKGNYKTFVMGFPFENVLNQQQRNELMLDVLNFLSEK